MLSEKSVEANDKTATIAKHIIKSCGFNPNDWDNSNVFFTINHSHPHIHTMRLKWLADY